MARSFARPEMTKQSAMVQLKMRLANATDEGLAALTVHDLVRSYRIPEREIECVLLASQASRRREIAERERAA